MRFYGVDQEFKGAECSKRLPSDTPGDCICIYDTCCYRISRIRIHNISRLLCEDRYILDILINNRTLLCCIVISVAQSNLVSLYNSTKPEPSNFPKRHLSTPPRNEPK